MIPIRQKYNFSFLSLFLILGILSPVLGDTVIWKPNDGEPGFYLDVPPDWDKDYEIKSNGVIFSATRGDLKMTVKSFSLATPSSAEELLTARAAYLSGRYSYLYLLREKILGEEGWGVIAYWKLRHRKLDYLEKTVIYVKDSGVLILICSGPKEKFEQAKVIFDNAILSFGFYDPDMELDPGVESFEISPPPTQPLPETDSSQPVEPPMAPETETSSPEPEEVVEEPVEESVSSTEETAGDENGEIEESAADESEKPVEEPQRNRGRR